jgi:hypothetical protein
MKALETSMTTQISRINFLFGQIWVRPRRVSNAALTLSLGWALGEPDWALPERPELWAELPATPCNSLSYEEKPDRVPCNLAKVAYGFHVGFS